MNSEHAEEILKVDYQNNQNRRFVATRLSLGENYLNIAKEKMELEIFEYIAIWYNKKRRHSTLNYKTIEEFNNQNNIYKNVA